MTGKIMTHIPYHLDESDKKTAGKTTIFGETQSPHQSDAERPFSRYITLEQHSLGAIQTFF